MLLFLIPLLFAYKCAIARQIMTVNYCKSYYDGTRIIASNSIHVIY